MTCVRLSFSVVTPRLVRLYRRCRCLIQAVRSNLCVRHEKLMLNLFARLITESSVINALDLGELAICMFAPALRALDLLELDNRGLSPAARPLDLVELDTSVCMAMVGASRARVTLDPHRVANREEYRLTETRGGHTTFL